MGLLVGLCEEYALQGPGPFCWVPGMRFIKAPLATGPRHPAGRLGSTTPSRPSAVLDLSSARSPRCYRLLTGVYFHNSGFRCIPRRVRTAPLPLTCHRCPFPFGLIVVRFAVACNTAPAPGMLFSALTAADAAAAALLVTLRDVIQIALPGETSLVLGAFGSWVGLRWAGRSYT